MFFQNHASVSKKWCMFIQKIRAFGGHMKSRGPHAIGLQEIAIEPTLGDLWIL